MEPLRWKRNSLVGSIFFGHVKRVRMYVSNETDTCEVRKFLIYAPFSWLFLTKIGKLKIVRPYIFVAALLAIWLTVTFPGPVIYMLLLIMGSVLAVLGVFLVVFVIGLTYTGINHFRVGKVVFDFLGRVLSRAYDILGRVLTDVVLFLVDGRLLQVPVWGWTAGILQVALYIFIRRWFWIATYFYVFAAVCLLMAFLVTSRERIENSSLPPLIKKTKAKITKEPEEHRESALDKLMDSLFEFTDMLLELYDSLKERVCKKVVWIDGD